MLGSDTRAVVFFFGGFGWCNIYKGGLHWVGDFPKYFWDPKLGGSFSSLSKHPSKCYKIAMIGRETMRTGLGGAIGKKQVEFFRND